MHFFEAHLLVIHCFFHVLRNELKATVLAWCPDNDSVTHKYLAEMRRLAHDETPFLSAMQLRAITLAYWPDDGNVIPLDTHDHDRSARDETSYPPANPLSILSFILVGPPFLIDKRFIAFLGDPWAKHLEGFISRLLSFTQQQSLWAFCPFFPWNERQPLLGSIHPKIPRDKEMGGLSDEKW
jgi:hypothetical protein